MWTSALSGLGMGLSLIVAIGAQNAFVLRQGIRREHVFAVVALCAVSDALLIAAGVSGIGAIVERVPAVIVVVRYGGALFLAVYAFLAARRAWSGASMEAGGDRRGSGLAATIGVCAALTWLNPHVYLDTVLLLGSVANGQGSRWWFAVGAMVGSVVWFAGLGYGARLLAPVFARRAAWRVLDAGIAVVMGVLAAALALG